MPKVVDHDERRRELADAVWRVIRRDGVEGASVRAVAREAGWSPGSLRHYFPTQSELLSTAMNAVVERIDTRMGDFRDLAPTDPRAQVEQALHELLPLDAERRAENEVWLAFTARALVDRELRARHREVDQSLRRVCTWAVETLAGKGKGRAKVDVATESARLHALMDGLALHAALTSGRQGDHITKVLAHHLDTLT
jgi:AcrR family transcriptional regulator